MSSACFNFAFAESAGARSADVGTLAEVASSIIKRAGTCNESASLRLKNAGTCADCASKGAKYADACDVCARFIIETINTCAVVVSVGTSNVKAAEGNSCLCAVATTNTVNWVRSAITIEVATRSVCNNDDALTLHDKCILMTQKAIVTRFFVLRDCAHASATARISHKFARRGSYRLFKARYHLLKN